MKKSIILIIVLISSLATTSGEKKCHGVYFNGRYYDLEIIKEGVSKVHRMVLNRQENILYFTFQMISRYPRRVVGFINLDSNVSGVIEDIRNATSLTVDQKHGMVYVGGPEGVYAINQQRVPEKLSISDDVRSVFYKNALYYVNKDRQAFKYTSGVTDLIQELDGVRLEDILADDDENLFFLDSKTLYRIKLHTKAVNIHEKYVVNAMTTDIYDKPYVCTADGVYVYNKYKYALDNVSGLRNLRALTFSRMNNPIYSVADVIVKLNPNPIPCHEF